MKHGPHHNCLICNMAKAVRMMEKHPDDCSLILIAPVDSSKEDYKRFGKVMRKNSTQNDKDYFVLYPTYSSWQELKHLRGGRMDSSEVEKVAKSLKMGIQATELNEEFGYTMFIQNKNI